MTREQRLVTLAFLALVAVGVLAFASSSKAVPERPIARLLESDFAPVSLPAPQSSSPAVATTRPAATVGAAPKGASRVRLPRLATDAASMPALIRGTASWYPARGYVAAVHSWKWGDDPYLVAVCTIADGASRCVTATVSDYCEACVGPRLIDLSDDAFRVLAPLSQGVVRVTLEDLRP